VVIVESQRTAIGEVSVARRKRLRLPVGRVSHAVSVEKTIVTIYHFSMSLCSSDSPHEHPVLQTSFGASERMKVGSTARTRLPRVASSPSSHQGPGESMRVTNPQSLFASDVM